MLRTQHNGLGYYRFHSLAEHPMVTQAVFSRTGGASSAPFFSLNVGQLVGDDPIAVEHNLSLIHEALGLPASSVVSARQVHGTEVAVARRNDAGRVFPATDALVTDVPGLTLMLRFADCVPIMLYDPTHHAIGLVHAGWRGTVGQVLRQTLLRMRGEYGTVAEHVVSGIGPSVGPCCYEVGEKVVAQLGVLRSASHRAPSGGRYYLDLWKANRLQLLDAGVRQIEIAGLCTVCRRDEFFSHRAEKGRAGRFPAVLGLAPEIGGTGASKDEC